MKKILSMLLCLVMAIGLLAGCVTTSDGSDETKEAEQITLTIGVLADPLVISFEENFYTKWLEEQTGYNLEFYEFPSSSADAKSVFSTMVVDGGMPDIIWDIDLGRDVAEEYGEDGYLVDLKPYFDDKEGASKIFWERFALLDETTQAYALSCMTARDSDAMYRMPELQTSAVDTMDSHMYINQAWLDKLGLEAPTDLESLYEVLKAFKTLGDEVIPMIGDVGAMGSEIVNWLITLQTVYNPDGRFMADENGKLYVPEMTDGYREALIYINKLVTEGLLSPMCWTISASEAKAMNSVVPSNVGIFAGHLTLKMAQDSEAIFDYEALNLFGNAYVNLGITQLGTYITSACEHPDEAFNLLMNMYSEEGSKRLRYGVPGMNWVEADEGAKSNLGWDADIKVLHDPYDNTQQINWGKIGSTILLYAEGETAQVSEDASDWVKKKNELTAAQVENYYAAYEATDWSGLVRNQVFTSEENEYIKQIKSDCDGFISKTRAEFCTGEKDPNDDAAWDAYLAELKTLGIDEYMKIAQGAYDRTKSAE